MKAGIFEGPGKIAVKNIAKPKIEKPTDAVVRVLRACVCAQIYGGIGAFLSGLLAQLLVTKQLALLSK